MRWPLYRLVAVVFSMACVAALFGLYEIWANPLQIAASVTKPEIHHFTAAQPIEVATGIYTNSVTRPIFTPTRQKFVATILAPEPAAAATPSQPVPLIIEDVSPPAAPVAEPPPASDAGVSPDQLQLKGVVITPTAAKALIVSPQDPAGIWLEKGAKTSNWQVEVIEKQQVTLRTGDTVIILQLYLEKSGNPL
jgi:hypothetical protein